METCDVVVVGGGLGGLSTAALLARGGQRVVLVERASHLGGRARTSDDRGYHLNFGPHAVYLGGPAQGVLTELGAMPEARPPRFGAPCGVREGRLVPLPTSGSGLLTASFLSWRERIEVARFFAAASLANVNALEAVPLDAWLEERRLSPVVRDLAAALLRVSTYAADHARMSAGAALRQLRRALKPGVVYVDHGWGSLVAAVARQAADAGAVVLSGAGARRIAPAGRGWRIEAGDRTWEARHCVLAGSPQTAAGLVEGEARAVLSAWEARARPIYAACLDLALSKLPVPDHGFAVGFDAPLYFSVHTMGARLAPAGGAVVHVARYLAGETIPAADEAELEALMDLVQPGWREHVVERRFLPRMTVSHALVEAAHGGQAGRPGPRVPGAPGLFVVGDWVGPEGQLLDAVLASARAASRDILRTSGRAAA